MTSCDVFLSYNSEDRPAVEAIAEKLKSKDLCPWLDERDLRPGLSWQRELEEQIKKSRSAAVFVGASGIAPWHREEMEALLQWFVKKGLPVIPVILSSIAKGQEPELPLFLQNRKWVDFHQKEPDPLKKNLIWGIKGKKPKDLAAPNAPPRR